MPLWSTRRRMLRQPHLQSSKRLVKRTKRGLLMNTNPSTDPEIEKIQQKKIAEMLKRAQMQSNSNGLSKPIILTDSNFSAEIAKHDLLVVDFWAPWCGPCRMVGPVIEQLAAEYSGKVTFGKMNVDENMTVPGSFRVMSIPTIMVFNNGHAVETIIGACAKSHIESKFKPFMKNSL
jgi:thioredoxin 1